MYKVAWLARYTKDKTKQEASDYWAESHGPAMKKVPPLAGYVQSHVTGALPLVTGVAEEETFFDGYSCAWWDSRPLRAGDEVAGVAGGRRRRRQRLRHAVALEHERAARGEHVIDGPSSPYKVVWVVRFKRGHDARGGPRVLGQHARSDLQGARHRPLRAEPRRRPDRRRRRDRDAEIGFDGFSECWFKNEQQFLDAVESDTWAVAVEDGLKVFDMSQLWGAVLRENVVVAPPVPATR